MPLPRMNLAGDACCEPCIEPCGTCSTGDCVEAGLMIQFRGVSDYKCGWPPLQSDDADEPDPDDDRRWRVLTMRLKNDYNLEVTGPLVGVCAPYVGHTYEAHLEVTAIATIDDPPYAVDAPCWGDHNLTIDGSPTFYDSNGSGTIEASTSPDLPSYDGYGTHFGLRGLFFPIDGADFFFATGCERGAALVSTVMLPDASTHQLWQSSDTRTFTFDDDLSNGHDCTYHCTSENESEYTLSDEFTTTDLIANVSAAMAAETPGGTSFFEASAWLGADREDSGGELYCSARWLEYSFIVIPPPGQNATVTWDVKTYEATEEGVAGATLLSTDPMSELNPDGSVQYDLHPAIGGPNVVILVENIVVTCSPV